MSGTVVHLESRRVRQQPGAAVAKQRWQAGLVVPHRITMALDLAEAHGPQVDEACGVKPPTVDRWEQGLIYPTWDELCRLAAYTGFGVAWFVADSEDLATAEFHFRERIGGQRVVCRVPPAVLAFTRNAINRTLGGSGR